MKNHESAIFVLKILREGILGFIKYFVIFFFGSFLLFTLIRFLSGDPIIKFKNPTEDETALSQDVKKGFFAL